MYAMDPDGFPDRFDEPRRGCGYLAAGAASAVAFLCGVGVFGFWFLAVRG